MVGGEHELLDGPDLLELVESEDGDDTKLEHQCGKETITYTGQSAAVAHRIRKHGEGGTAARAVEPVGELDERGLTLGYEEGEAGREGGGDGPFPAWVHENACNRPDPAPPDQLKPVVNGRSETVIEVSFQHLRTSPHSVIVHKSRDALDDYLSCGSIGRLGSPEREESLLER